MITDAEAHVRTLEQRGVGPVDQGDDDQPAVQDHPECEHVDHRDAEIGIDTTDDPRNHTPKRV